MTVQPAGSAPAGPAVAPQAPGRLGEAADVGALSAYLAALADWVDRRRRELDHVDAASLRADDPDAYSADVTLSMALWQSVSDRQAALARLWDSGRADATARERMSQVIWARMDPGTGGAASGGMALSLVEACRLSDALITQLTTRLAFDPSAADAPARVAALRGALERLRELVKQEPSWSAQVENLAVRVNDLATRAMRGADVSAPLKQLETDAAQAERDLIVRTASVRQAERDRVAAARRLVVDRKRAADQLAALRVREEAARELVARCVAQIARAPRFAVPEPDVLGEVPAERAALDAYLARLDAVGRAMGVVEKAYAAPLAKRQELLGLLDVYRVMARRTGQEGDPVVAAALEQVRSTLATVPCDVVAAEAYCERLPMLIRSAAPTGADPRQERP
ncbi:MAG TPA: hypothetical protein VI248_03040 [Kineosporiaceae bacterium]